MFNLQQILVRADEITTQELLGEQTVKILKLINKESIYLSDLKKVIFSNYSSSELLSDKAFRDAIIDLLKVDEAKSIANIFGVYDRNDDVSKLYKKLKSIKFQKNSANFDTLLSIFNIRKKQISVQEEQAAQNPITVQYGLFKHQRTAANKVKQILNTGHERVMLHMPTGSGKTRTAMNIIADYLRLNEGALVIWLANTEELCEQASEEFEKAWTALGNRNLSIYRHWRNFNTDINDLEEGLIVAGLQKLIMSSKNVDGRSFVISLANRVSLVIFDEAHQSIAPAYSDIVNYLLDLGQKKKFIGLSATPGRSFRDTGEDIKLANFYHHKKVKLEIDGFANPIDYLTEENYLADVKFKYINYKNVPSLDYESEKDDFRLNQDYKTEVLSRLAEDEKRNLLLINEAIRLSKTHKRIILFAPSVSCSNIISLVLQSQGVRARSLTSGTSNETRKQIISDFKNCDDVPKILCNYGVLTTGFDAPKTSAAIIGRPTTSLILYSQMVGRAIRGTRAGGNSNSEIVTVIDEDLPGFRSVAEAFENWEDIWE